MASLQKKRAYLAKEFLSLLQGMIQDNISHQGKFKEKYNISDNLPELLKYICLEPLFVI